MLQVAHVVCPSCFSIMLVLSTKFRTCCDSGSLCTVLSCYCYLTSVSPRIISIMETYSNQVHILIRNIHRNYMDNDTLRYDCLFEKRLCGDPCTFLYHICPYKLLQHTFHFVKKCRLWDVLKSSQNKYSSLVF